MDINPRHLVTASLLADHFSVVPPCATSEFPAALLRVIEECSIDTYMPLIDQEIAIASDLRRNAQLPAKVELLAPAWEQAMLCLDKWKAAQWMQQQGIPTPKTALAMDPFGREDYFLKPRAGFGSRGARTISMRELQLLSNDERQSSIIQEMCSGPEVTVDCYFDPLTQFLRVACRERLEVKSGVCTKARVFYDPPLADLGGRLARELQLAGSFCFQVMRGGEQWLVTDLNARPGAGTAICAAVGLDFCAATLARAWGIDPRACLPEIKEEYIVTRQYTEFVMRQ
jgi:carbamoyl-phosphate synthase large subunit